jgi:hypothetical protein
MSTDWTDYKPFDPGIRQPLHEVSRRDAKAAYERLMAAKEERIAQLDRLLRANGLRLDDSDEGIARLNDWFRSEVEPDPNDPNRLRPLWYAVVNDLALFLGDVIISRAPMLHWAFFDGGARDAAFQRHVLMGFTRVANPKFNVDIDLQLAALGTRIVKGKRGVGDEFKAWIDKAVELA